MSKITEQELTQQLIEKFKSTCIEEGFDMSPFEWLQKGVELLQLTDDLTNLPVSSDKICLLEAWDFYSEGKTYREYINFIAERVENNEKLLSIFPQFKGQGDIHVKVFKSE